MSLLNKESPAAKLEWITIKIGREQKMEIAAQIILFFNNFN